MAVHMTMAMLFGTVVAAAAVRLPASRSLVIAAGMLFTALRWAVMHYGIWRAVGATAARDMTSWVFAVAHLMFGLLAAMFAGIVIEDAEPPPRHALPRQSAGPRNWFALPSIGASRPVALPSSASSGGHQTIKNCRRAHREPMYELPRDPPRLQFLSMADTPLSGVSVKASSSPGQTRKSGPGKGDDVDTANRRIGRAQRHRPSGPFGRDVAVCGSAEVLRGWGDWVAPGSLGGA
jgi:hypothetical protein